MPKARARLRYPAPGTPARQRLNNEKFWRNVEDENFKAHRPKHHKHGWDHWRQTRIQKATWRSVGERNKFFPMTNRSYMKTGIKGEGWRIQPGDGSKADFYKRLPPGIWRHIEKFV